MLEIYERTSKRINKFYNIEGKEKRNFLWCNWIYDSCSTLVTASCRMCLTSHGSPLILLEVVQLETGHYNIAFLYICVVRLITHSSFSKLISKKYRFSILWKICCKISCFSSTWFIFAIRPLSNIINVGYSYVNIICIITFIFLSILWNITNYRLQYGLII